MARTGTCHLLSSNGIARSSSPLTAIRVDSIQQIESPNTGLSPQIGLNLLLLVLELKYSPSLTITIIQH